MDTVPVILDDERIETELPHQVRIGMAAGEPVAHNDDLFGAAVNLASRICDAADARQILVSDLVQELGAKGGFSFQATGERPLKGFSDPTRVYELRRTD